MHKKSQILGFFTIYVSLFIIKILSKSEKWSPELVRFAMEHTIYIVTWYFNHAQSSKILFKSLTSSKELPEWKG